MPLSVSEAVALKAALTAAVDAVTPPPVPPPPPPPIPPPVAVDTSDSRVTVTASAIITPHDTIPIPAGSLWVASGQTVVVQSVDDTRLGSIVVGTGGIVRFDRNVPTRLRCTTLIVLPGGTLDLGTEADPITSKAEIIFNDVPLDTVNDPQQYGNGLIVLGSFTACGLSKDSFLRLAVEPKAGDTTLTLEAAPVGWKAGDSLILPDSRQLLSTEKWAKFIPQWERAKVASISGPIITLEAPLTFAHPAAFNADAGLEAMPHVGNLTRNIVIKSENMNGIRGHVMFSRRAHVRIRGVQFGGLGRTTSAAISATNPAGRYPLHFHHCYGPVDSKTDASLLPLVEDCSVFCPLDPMPFRWGMVLHDTHYATIRRNVLFNWNGAGIVTEEGNETENTFEENFVVGIRGNANPRNNDGLDGSCFWFAGFNHRLRNNVATSAANYGQGIVTGVGFNLFVPAATSANTKIPKWPGADPGVDYLLVNRQAQPLLEFSQNEAYGCMATGLALWHVNRNIANGLRSNVDRLRSWHCWEEGFFGYPIRNVTFTDFADIGQARCIKDVGGNHGWSCGDYMANGIILIRPRITNKRNGIYGSTNTTGEFRIEEPDLQCSSVGIDFPMLATPGSGGSPGPREVVITSPRFRTFPGYSNAMKIRRSYQTNLSGVWLVNGDSMRVEDMDGVPGDSFEVYLPQQAPEFIVPQTTGTASGHVHGSPVAGLTNAENLAQYGICISGKLLPANAVDRVGIGGKVVPTLGV